MSAIVRRGKERGPAKMGFELIYFLRLMEIFSGRAARPSQWPVGD